MYNQNGEFDRSLRFSRVEAASVYVSALLLTMVAS